ncbi:MAG: hypothetical protein EXS37_10515 [Opitutus sp.]|nr:hypothetical protein [Opitutus sp.]
MVELYSWPAHPVASMTAALLQAHVQTGEPIFLEPLLQMAALRRAHLAAGNRDGTSGSAAWAAHRLPGIINDALAKWRQLTGDPRFDDLLKADANGYVRYVLTNDTARLTQELAATAATLSVNWPMFADEVRFTDRVLSFPHYWPRTVATGLHKIDAALIYSTVTGDPGTAVDFPLNGARWHTLPREFAVLVAENRRDHFSAELYHFGTAERTLSVSLLTLEPGRYRWKMTSGSGRILSSGERSIANSDRRLHFSVPAQTMCRLSVSSSSP